MCCFVKRLFQLYECVCVCVPAFWVTMWSLWLTVSSGQKPWKITNWIKHLLFQVRHLEPEWKWLSQVTYESEVAQVSWFLMSFSFDANDQSMLACGCQLCSVVCIPPWPLTLNSLLEQFLCFWVDWIPLSPLVLPRPYTIWDQWFCGLGQVYGETNNQCPGLDHPWLLGSSEDAKFYSSLLRGADEPHEK